MKIDYLTLPPGMFDGALNYSILKRAQDKGIIEINAINLRDYAENKHDQVDDYPYGDGQGMVLRSEPVSNAMQDLKRTDKTRVILTCPQGRPFSQAIAEKLGETKHIVFICGCYEECNEKIRENLVTDETSMGDYVLTDGGLLAMTMTDIIVRLIPEVLGNEQPHQNDPFPDGLLKFLQYTRPRECKDMTVPDVLLSGNHADIEKWWHKQKLIYASYRRPDLLEKYQSSDKDKEFLESHKNQLKNN